MTVPTLDEFLALPDHEVASIAPEAVIYAPAGTRRRAMLDGIPEEAYSTWAMSELASTVAMFVRLGVRHIVVPILGPHQLSETHNDYGKHVLDWVVQQALGPELERAARTVGFRVRLIGPATSSNPDIHHAAAQLSTRPVLPGRPVLWLYTVQSYEEVWDEVLAAAVRSGSTNRVDLVRYLYGEEIPSARLLIGFGRLFIHPRILPLLMFEDDLHCYWTQRAGFGLTEQMLRRIMYDALFARKSTPQERIVRYNYVSQLRQHWEGTSIIGIGHARLGFWFPEAFPQD